MYLLLVFLPLFSSITAGLFGRKIGPKGSSFLTVLCLLITCLISCFLFIEVALNNSSVYINLIKWIDCDLFQVDWGFLFDTLTVSMCFVVTFVSFLVHLYSTEYMSHDPHLPRFMSYLSLFTFFMLILVTADNFVQMFVGWEGVGLCSYLLINFWFTRIQANKAALKAMIVNRIGDFGLALGIFTIFVSFKAVDYATVFSLVPLLSKKSFFFFNLSFNVLDIIGIFLFIGAMGKSAQLGLHTWLPDAMEGPTPVSALIHAATMVTAGVFLLARCSCIYEYTPNVLIFITFLGSSTAFFAATVGLVQNDLKRVIAYSTCSQLGYMVFACGLSNYNVGVFHLINHAFFKALLFLSAGSVIHAVFDEQDMRKMGGLKKLVPFTYSMIVIGSLALAGFPFLTGFYSKDVILEVAYGKYTNISHYSYILGTLGAFLTAFYSTRLIYLTFLSKPNGFKNIICYAYDSSYRIIFALGCLSIPSIFAGYFTKDMIIGLGSDYWGNSIFILPENMNLIDAEFIDYLYKILPVCLSMLGLISAYILYTFFIDLLFIFKRSYYIKYLFTFLNKKWFFDKVYNEYITQPLLLFSYSTSYKLIDRGIIEIFGPMGLSNLTFLKSKTFSKLQTNFLYNYSLLFLITITLLLIYNLLGPCLSVYLNYKIYFVIILTLMFI
jgi:NADH-ubiquinone oxidoreductase chain 5|uniref:NADH-ubiquinone oxidoreductase chain 5 n=1 Tax=Sundstroemia setigera TaxID=3005 RepID=A0A8A6KER3_9STRA|nr:NADH dehydrogenase subunit 5 [Rhizosolenia setigera]QTI82394.1 NADH dehydrogenase subunit 5 [Rhizosolenia setigera]WAQ69957.1 NADH dehydrogenase subunit 5 [Rhizosolenia setigera]WAQ69993.1 NADH dehydrogenase subunit 5 [Rhizosolenia setigera]WAQ70029.1 NADH dehydrogenase subunit 5 [Rhizosolenia setigera]WAQ70065.1 NADH dehydrogenase subunit 5 [Rhizosolenia setigera]